MTLHRVVEVCERDHDVLWMSFRRLLDDIAGSGLTPGTGLAAGAPLHGRGVVLTFDDATEDHARVGEELAQRGLTAVFFVPAGKVGSAGRLSAVQLRSLSALGHVIGSHTMSDVQLRNEMSSREIGVEVGDSRALLEDMAGARVRYFAPPGGVGARWLPHALQDHGYVACRSMVWGLYQSPSQRWNIPCVPVTEFTHASGWVKASLTASDLPPAMRSIWAFKSLLPGTARGILRRWLHHPFRAPGRGQADGGRHTRLSGE